ncbi:MAG: hypothetical protein WBN96_02565 [Gammaproteobacteria bacterium]
MHHAIKRFILACFVLSISQSALASDDKISIVGGVAYNWKNEDFKISGKPFKPEFTTIDWSLIAAYQSFYVKVNFDQSIKDSYQIDNSSSGSGGPDNQAILFSRDDIGLTFGYSVLDNITLFAGFTRGETEGAGTGQIDVGTVPSFSTTVISIIEQGPFVGAIYSYHFKKSGSLSLSLAYAKLDGEVILRSASTAIATGVTTIDTQSAIGNADGLSYSIGWTDQFAENILYNISFKQTDYKFDAPEVAGQDSSDFDDTYLAFLIGLSKFF